MPPELDPYILSTMTDAERASIQEEPTPEEIAAIAAIASGAEDNPNIPDAELPDDGAAPAKAEVAPAKVEATPVKAEAAPVNEQAAAGAEAAKPEAKAVEAKPTDPTEQAFVPTYNAKLPDDFAAKETALKGQAEALAAKFKAGDMEFDQYRIEAEALAKSERELNEVRFRASLSQEMTAQSAEQQWNHTVQRFIAAIAKAENIDYKTDTEKNADLDLFVRSLARDPKNEDKAPEWFLAEAHKRVKALHGIGVVTPPAVVDPKASRKPPLDAVPKTLAQVPGGDGPGDVDGNEFSDIDRLNGDALEDAIRKMTPAQRDRYMAGV